MAVKYPYSNELKASAVGTDYDMCELALSGKMGMTAKVLKFQTDGFHPKRAEKQVCSYPLRAGQTGTYYAFTPKETKPRYPAILYYHGGGFMFPVQKAMMQNSEILAAECGAKVFLPDYRYAPNVSCGEVMADCCDMLQYVFEHAEELQVDTRRVMLYGDSAGGCLAACTSIWNRDHGHSPLRGQMLISPVCDCDSEKYPSINEYPYAVWSRKANASMWKLYFHKGVDRIEDVVPMKNDCHDLPQAYVEPQEMDVLRDEAIAYANKLKRSGVAVECNLIGGSFHGFDAQLKSPLVKRVFAHRCEVIRRWLA